MSGVDDVDDPLETAPEPGQPAGGLLPTALGAMGGDHGEQVAQPGGGNTGIGFGEIWISLDL